MTIVHLDACCLNRPFDDQSQPRVHLEAEAVLIILARLKTREWEWLGSPVLNLEIDQTNEPTRKARIKLLMTAIPRVVSVQAAEENRAKQLSALGLPAVDALHIACAESGGADVSHNRRSSVAPSRAPRGAIACPRRESFDVGQGAELRMGTPPMTLEQIRVTGLAALMEKLGPDGMIRFLQQFETGAGDYSTERHQRIDQWDMDTLIKKLREQQSKTG